METIIMINNNDIKRTSPISCPIQTSLIVRHLGLVVPSANYEQMKTSVSGMYACITSLIPKFAEGQATNYYKLALVCSCFASII